MITRRKEERTRPEREFHTGFDSVSSFFIQSRHSIFALHHDSNAILHHDANAIVHFSYQFHIDEHFGTTNAMKLLCSELGILRPVNQRRSGDGNAVRFGRRWRRFDLSFVSNKHDPNVKFHSGFGTWRLGPRPKHVLVPTYPSIPFRTSWPILEKYGPNPYS